MGFSSYQYTYPIPESYFLSGGGDTEKGNLEILSITAAITAEFSCNILVTKPVVVHYENSQSALYGLEDHRFGSKVQHFRGIPSGLESERFSKPQPVPNCEDEVIDATQSDYV